MHKIRFERNKRAYGNCIGSYVEGYNEVIDILTFQKNLYLLTVNEQCKIFKVVSTHELVEISEKKMLNMRRVFENPNMWKEHTKVELTNSGKIKSYTLAPKPWEKSDGMIVIFIEV